MCSENISFSILSTTSGFSNHFASSARKNPEQLVKGYGMNVPFMVEHSTLSHSMQNDQTRVSCLVLQEETSLEKGEESSNFLGTAIRY